MKRLIIVLCVAFALWGVVISGSGERHHRSPMVQFLSGSGISDYIHDVTHPRLSLKTQFKLWRTSRRVHKSLHRFTEALQARVQELSGVVIR
jgi:hypothetical protein